MERKIERLQTIIVSWYGPFSADELPDWGYCLYIFAGRKKRKHFKTPLYCGITERTFRERFREHINSGKIKELEDQCSSPIEIWLGFVGYPHSVRRVHLERAEKLLIYSIGYEGNIAGKRTPPYPTCLISRWYFDEHDPYGKKPEFARNSADVVWYQDGQY